MVNATRRVNPLIKRAGAGVLTVVMLLLISGLSWGDTTVYVYQAETTGALTVKTVGGNGLIATVPQTPPGIPNSCFKPDLLWDSAAGALRLNGFDDAKNPSWTGTIDATGNFESPMDLPDNDCTAVAPAVPSAIVSGIFPEALPCASYGEYGACSNGFMVRTATPANCSDPLRSIPCPTTVTPCGWDYGSWIPSDTACTSNQPQFRTATASPAGCIGSPAEATIKLCPPQACTDYTYTAWSACVSNQQTRTQTGKLPAGCTGDPSTQPVLSQDCTQTIACTNYTYSAWSECTNNQQTRTQTGLTPANCSGNPSVDPVLTQSCSSGGTSGYQNLELNCKTGTATTVTNTHYLYTFTVPQGIYNTVNVAYQQQYSGVWSEQIVIKKDGNVTKADYDNLMANFTSNPVLRSQIATGADDMWYQLKPSGDTIGTTLLIKNSGDRVISTAKNSSGLNKTTLTRDVTFTMVLVAGDVGANTVPSSRTHKVRYCYQ